MQHLNAYWLTAAFFALGLFPGLLAVRWLRLPACFWIPVTLAAGSLVAYGTLWAYFFAPIHARSITPAIVLASAIGFAGWVQRSKEIRAYLADRDAWWPGLLMVSLMTAYLAFLGWAGVPSMSRFAVPLPPEDHLVPRYLADRLFFGYYQGVTPPPITTFIFETRSSDRPPLQAGVVLSVRALGSGRGASAVDNWTYQVLTTFCQLGWVPALYALSRSLGLTSWQMTFVLIGTAGSGFFLLHSLYTWPKLFAAWLFLTAIAIIIRVVRGAASPTMPLAVGTGCLFALSLLAHGGPFFSMLALPVFFAQRGAWRLVRPRHVFAVVLAGALVLAPWIAYQRYYDPPGNRLLKIHLAGVEPVDDRGTLETMWDSYTQIGLDAYVAGRWENLKEQWLVFGKFGYDDLVAWAQWQQFFHHIPALDALVLGLLGIAVRPRASGAAAQTAAAGFGLRQVFWYALAALVCWIVVLFPPGSAMIHHGSFATTALLFFCAAAFAALLPVRLAVPILLLHVAVFLVCWLPAQVYGEASMRATWNVSGAALMTTAFLAFAAAAIRIPSAARG